MIFNNSTFLSTSFLYIFSKEYLRCFSLFKLNNKFLKESNYLVEVDFF